MPCLFALLLHVRALSFFADILTLYEIRIIRERALGDVAIHVSRETMHRVSLLVELSYVARNRKFIVYTQK